MSVRIKRIKLDYPLTLNLVSQHRYVDCERYDKCLNKVIKKGWVSFSCSKCPQFIKRIKQKLNRRFIYEKAEKI